MLVYKTEYEYICQPLYTFTKINRLFNLRSTTFHIIILLFFAPFLGLSQKDFTLKINVKGDDEKIVRKINYKQTHSDSLSTLNELSKTIQFLHEKSFLLASYDTVFVDKNKIIAELTIGKPFNWAILKQGNLTQDFIREVDFKEKIFKGALFSFDEVAKLETKILRFAENSGFPFASIALDSIQIYNETITASLKFKPNIKINFDSLGIVGNAQINRKFLRNYLQIIPGEPFDQSKIDKIKPRLQKLNICVIKREPEIRFINGKAYVYLFLDAKRTTSIDGIAGLQQDKLDRDKLLLTGEFNLNLRNILQSGKQGEIHWRKLDRGTTTLLTSYKQPALFGSPLELNASFNFLNQDSNFITINPKIGFKYNFLKLGAIGFFFELNDTRLQDTSLFSGATTLPPFADSKLSAYGLTYDWNNLDNFFIPRKGLIIELEASVGNKVIDKVLAPQLYEGINLKTLQIQGNGKIENHIQLKKNFTFVQRLMGAWTINERLFFNDLYRIGGINSIRGFRDYSFFASKYAIETLELRIFTEETSYFMIFADYSQFVTEIEGDFQQNTPLGFGGGLSFTTRAGIFNMVYAIGKERGGTINFNNSVVNFGLVSRF